MPWKNKAMGGQGVLDKAHVNCFLDFSQDAHFPGPRQGDEAGTHARTHAWALEAQQRREVWWVLPEMVR